MTTRTAGEDPGTGTAGAAARPLTEAQAGLWFAQRLDPQNPVFNTGQYVAIDGPLDVEIFRAAVDAAMKEADVLAVRLDEEDGEPRQIVDETRRAWLEVVDCRGRERPRDQALAAIGQDLATPLDLATDRLVAHRLYIVGNDSYLWYLRVHHVLIDGYGTSLLTDRIADLYSSRVRGTVPVTGTLGSLTALVEADEKYRAAAARQADRDFWRAYLTDAPAAASLVPAAAMTSRRYLQRAISLPPHVGPVLGRLADETKTPWPDVLTALVAAYVTRHAGGSEATLGITSMGRLGSPAARVPGMVMNVLPVRIAVDEEQPLAEWLARAGAACREARRHGRYRGEQIRRELNLLGGDRRLHGPIVNVLPFEQAPSLDGVRSSLHVLATGPVDDFTVTWRGDARLDQMRAEIDVNPALYSQADLDAHAERLVTFITKAVEAGRLAGVPTVTDAEAHQILEVFNDTAHPVEDTTLDALIRRMAARLPDAPALSMGDRVLSFQAFEQMVAELAGGLHRAGVVRGDIVAVAIPRSIEMVVALHAIVRLGAAYLPLDLDSPAARVARIVSSARPRVVLTAPGTDALLSADVATLALADALTGPAVDDAVPGPEPGAAAYVIYTSGSTGDPKGVVIEHRAIVNRLEWMREEYNVGPGDRILQKTPSTFDVSVWEFFLTFLSGATLVVAPPGVHKDPQALAALMVDERITMAHFVPSMMAEWLAEPQAARGSLRAIICSGEALPSALRDRFHERIGGELHNLYGPTEAAVDVTAWAADANDRSEPVPIGRPVWNTRLYVVDDRHRLLPPGVPGHLCLAGIQLAREYLGRPDLTADRFVPDPFGAPGERMYRTGDVARWRPDGAMEFLGRSDHQVKIRGQRIELGEIEHVLSGVDEVARVVVLAREDRPGDQRLVAYVERAPGSDIDEARLRRYASAGLTEAMVPSVFVFVDTWPTTTNGKLDRGRLPAPAASAVRRRAPETHAERAVVAEVAALLDLDEQDVDADADFFALGGHSLLAARLVRRLREEWGSDVGLGSVFEHQTLSALAAHLDRLRSRASDGVANDLSELTVLRAAPPLLPALTCVHPAGGLAWCYHTLARTIAAGRPVYGLQARGLRADQPLPVTLDVLAVDYVNQLRAVQPSGPYHLLGWSIGGIIAQAMAVALEAQGETVGVLAMLDAYPSDRWRGLTDPDEAATLRAVLLMAGERPESVPPPLTRERVVERLRAGQHPLGALSDQELSGVLRVVAHNNRLVRRHEHTPCAAPLLHVRADLEHADDGVNAEEWRPYVGRIDARHVASLHAHMTGPDVSRIVAASLEEYL